MTTFVSKIRLGTSMGGGPSSKHRPPADIDASGGWRLAEYPLLYDEI